MRPRAGRGCRMAAMKPRTGDGPLEVTKEGRGIVMRVPLEGGGRLVVEMSAEEAGEAGGGFHGAPGRSAGRARAGRGGPRGGGPAAAGPAGRGGPAGLAGRYP